MGIAEYILNTFFPFCEPRQLQSVACMGLEPPPFFPLIMTTPSVLWNNFTLISKVTANIPFTTSSTTMDSPVESLKPPGNSDSTPDKLLPTQHQLEMPSMRIITQSALASFWIRWASIVDSTVYKGELAKGYSSLDGYASWQLSSCRGLLLEISWNFLPNDISYTWLGTAVELSNSEARFNRDGTSALVTGTLETTASRPRVRLTCQPVKFRDKLLISEILG